MRRYYGRPLDDPSMSPFRCDGYVAEGQIRDDRGESIPLAALPPFLRALLVTDGTVTKILEAYFWEPVAVDTLEQRFETAQAAVPWIGLTPGSRCLVRDARLRGVHSGRAFAEALSLIRTELIPEDFRRRLIDREIGIGALIRDSGLESYREVLDVGVDRDAEGDVGESVFRTYRIIIGGHPVILITERFALALFQGDTQRSPLVQPSNIPRPPA
ncbi:chorismate--pyruvate lyase family protein [Lamprocystis purpurea]|jgi:chorismate-pyruvate lyase|uniref:chorismate--pyruvate lyase family protein n=1 Tax=Lamprocystis purpurea TaxID=61598 RepID=UPI0003787BEB|nr:chorismate pyruvate-lyase family protein [Lamprocystis purpurea]